MLCSYYNQLGDQFIFSKDIDELNQGKIFLQRFNVLIVGRPGSGKSTFINTLLGDKRCRVGGGESVTNKIVQYHHSKYPLLFYDTPGLENENDITNVMNLLIKFDLELQQKKIQIHLILYLVNAQDRTLITLDNIFLKQLIQYRKKSNHSKTLLSYIITKSDTIKSGQIAKCQLITDLKKSNYFNNEQVFPIETSDIYQTIQPFGINQFMNWLYETFKEHKISNDVITQYQTINDENEICSFNTINYFLFLADSREAILCSCESIAYQMITVYSLIGFFEGLVGFNLEFFSRLNTAMIKIIWVLVFYYRNI